MIDGQRLAVRRRRARQLVPRPRHRRRQRGGHRRRSFGPRELPGVQAQHAPVGDADHGLRRPPDRRPRHARLDRRDQDDATQLDRSQSRRVGALRLPRRSDLGVHDPTRHVVRGDVHGPLARASARRRAHDIRSVVVGRRVSPGGDHQEGHRPPGRGSREDRDPDGDVGGQPGHRRRDPDLDRRLRADGLRHRGDHGRAVRRPARLRVRRQVRTRDPRHPAAARRVVRRARHRTDARHVAMAGRLHRRRAVRQLVERVPRPERHRLGGRGRPPDERMARGQRARRGDDHLQAARLVVQPPALLGRAVPDRVRRRRPAARAPRRDAPRRAPRHRTASRRARSTPTTSSPTRRARSIDSRSG